MIDATALALGSAAAVGTGVAAVGGFFVGYRAAASAPDRLLRRAGRDTGRCLAEAAGAIDLAGRFCDAVASAAKVTERQVTSLIEGQKTLADSISRLCAASRSFAAAHQPEIKWQREPLDEQTGIPDRAAFEANVAALITAASGIPRGGVLVVSLDGADRLRRRVGEAAFAEVRRTVARLLCRAGREDDLACRFDDRSFGVLMADPEPDDAVAHAAAVRDVFRGHPFRLGADGPEMLVTASFGFTPVLPGDESRLVIDRAEAGVARSRRWGRNRLHAFDAGWSRFRLVPDAPPARRPASASA